MDWHMSRRAARWTIACIWLFSLSIAMPWAVYFTLVPFALDSSNTIHVCAEEWPSERIGTLYFVCANLILCYLLPATVIILCYLGIWYKIERRNIPGTQPKGLKVELIIQKSKLKVVKMMVVVVVIFLLSWAPLYLIFVRIKFVEEKSQLEEKLITNLMPLAQWLGASNSCINPILYTFFNRKYKQGFIELLRFGFCCKPKVIGQNNSRVISGNCNKHHVGPTASSTAATGITKSGCNNNNNSNNTTNNNSGMSCSTKVSRTSILNNRRPTGFGSGGGGGGGSGCKRQAREKLIQLLPNGVDNDDEMAAAATVASAGRGCVISMETLTNNNKQDNRKSANLVDCNTIQSVYYRRSDDDDDDDGGYGDEEDDIEDEEGNLDDDEDGEVNESTFDCGTSDAGSRRPDSLICDETNRQHSSEASKHQYNNNNNNNNNVNSIQNYAAGGGGRGGPGKLKKGKLKFIANPPQASGCSHDAIQQQQWSCKVANSESVVRANKGSKFNQRQSQCKLNLSSSSCLRHSADGDKGDFSNQTNTKRSRKMASSGASRLACKQSSSEADCSKLTTFNADPETSNNNNRNDGLSDSNNNSYNNNNNNNNNNNISSSNSNNRRHKFRKGRGEASSSSQSLTRRSVGKRSLRSTSTKDGESTDFTGLSMSTTNGGGVADNGDLSGCSGDILRTSVLSGQQAYDCTMDEFATRVDFSTPPPITSEQKEGEKDHENDELVGITITMDDNDDKEEENEKS